MGGNTFIPEILEREHLRWVGGNDTWNDGNEEKGAILIFIITAAVSFLKRNFPKIAYPNSLTNKLGLLFRVFIVWSLKCSQIWVLERELDNS